MLGGAAEPLFAADDVGDLHEVVVYDVSQMVGGHAVGFDEHLVVEAFGFEGNNSPDFVFEFYGFVSRNVEPDDVRVAGLESSFYLVLR